MKVFEMSQETENDAPTSWESWKMSMNEQPPLYESDCLDAPISGAGPELREENLIPPLLSIVIGIVIGSVVGNLIANTF